MSRPRSLSLLFPSSEFTTKKGGEGEGGATINKVSISFFRWFCLNSKCLRFVSLQGATQDAGIDAPVVLRNLAAICSSKNSEGGRLREGKYILPFRSLNLKPLD